MRFLIDRCAGRRLAEWLISQGHDVVHVAELGPDPGDATLLSAALEQRRILITIDADFGTLVFRDAAKHCGVIRLPDVLADQRIVIMGQLLEKHAGDMEASCIITVRGNRVRITQPPI